MDQGALIGIGTLAVSVFLPYAFKSIAAPVKWGGITLGLLLTIWGTMHDELPVPVGPAILFVVGIACIVGAVAWYVESPKPTSEGAMIETKPPPPTIINYAIGGAGGPATAINGGIAYAGPGGTAVIGGSGVGGTGGAAIADSPNSVSAGGQGGSVGSPTYWPHPAKSGYETHQRALGLPVDPGMRQLGRGGAVAGYEEKLNVVNQLRARYFSDNHLPSKTYFEDINAVPVRYLNTALTDMGLPWRVLVADGDEYDFFIP